MAFLEGRVYQHTYGLWKNIFKYFHYYTFAPDAYEHKTFLEDALRFYEWSLDKPFLEKAYYFTSWLQ